MKPRLFSRLAALLVSLTAGAMSTRSGAAIIYQQNFSGTANPLNGTSVQTGTGTWIANPQFNTSGTITSTTGGGGSAVLPFTPANGNIYQLTTNITWVGNASNLNDWIGAGFANNVALDPTESTDNLNRFVGNGNNANSDIYGFTWMLHRGSGQEGYEGYANNTAWGDFNSAAVVTLPTITGGSTSTVDLKFILNTTGASWTSSYYINNVLAGTSSYDSFINRVANANTTVTNANPPINSVGFTTTRYAGGSINSFKLETIPEPSAALLGALGTLALLRRRR